MIDGRPPDVIERIAGSIQVCRKFPFPKECGEIWKSTLTYDMTDSFMRSREEITHISAFKTKKVILEVELPRRCESAYMRFTYSGQQHQPLPNPHLSNNNQLIRAEIKRPRMGGHYHLGWEW